MQQRTLTGVPVDVGSIASSLLRSALLRRIAGLRSRPDSAGAAGGCRVCSCSCNGGISITTSAPLRCSGWDVLVEGIFVTACPRCGLKSGLLPPALAPADMRCLPPAHHSTDACRGSLDDSAVVADVRATPRSIRQNCPRAVRRHGLTHVPSSTVRATTVRTLSVQSKCSGEPGRSRPPWVAYVIVVSDLKMTSS